MQQAQPEANVEATRTMQYAISHAQKLHDEKEHRINYAMTHIKLHQDLPTSAIIAHLAEKFSVSDGGATGYFYVAKARLSGAAKEQTVQHSGAKNPFTVNGVRYTNNAGAARFLRISAVTLAWWTSVGKGIPSVIVEHPKTGVKYRVHSYDAIREWKKANPEMLAKVKRVKRSYTKTEAKAVRKAKHKAISAKVITDKLQGYAYGAVELALHLNINAERLRRLLRTHGHPQHTLQPRAGTSIYVYSKAQADVWAKRIGLYKVENFHLRLPVDGAKLRRSEFGPIKDGTDVGAMVAQKIQKLRDNVTEARALVKDHEETLAEWLQKAKALLGV